MNNNVIITASMNEKEWSVFETLFNKFKIKIKVEHPQDTEMTKEEYFDKIDRALASEEIKISRKELEKLISE